MVPPVSLQPNSGVVEPMAGPPLHGQVSPSQVPSVPRQTHTPITPTPVSQRESDRLSAILRKHEEKRDSSDKTQAVTSLADRIEAPWLKRLARKQEQTSLDKPTLKPHERPKPKMPESPQQRRRSQVEYVSGQEPEFTISPPTETDNVAPTIMPDFQSSPPSTSSLAEPIQRQLITDPLQSDMIKDEVVVEEEQRMETPVRPLNTQQESKPQAMPPATSAANKTGPVVQRRASDDLLSDDEVSPEMIRTQPTVSEVSSPAPEALVTPPMINVDEEGSDEKPEKVQRRETAASVTHQFTSQPAMTPPVVTHDEEAEPPLSAVERGESDPQAEIEAGLDETELNAESQASLIPGTSSSTLPHIEAETAELTESFAQTDEYYQPVPLQEALLMQKKSAPPPPKAPELIQPTSITPPTQELRRQETQDDAFIREHLQQVSSGQSSDSSVELVMPRRPRPTVMRRPHSSIQPPETTAEAEASTTNAAESAEDKLVDTEIGALPSDLWQLLGQAPPTTASVVTTAAAGEWPQPDAPISLWSPERASPDAGADNTAVVQPIPEPASLEHVTLSPSPATKVFGDVLPDIQRETYVPDSAPPASTGDGTSEAATADETADEAEEGEETEIDVEVLAQAVYRKLKRRLQVDRERSGRV